MNILLLEYGIVAAVLLTGYFAGAIVTRSVLMRSMEERYYEGVQEGQRLETELAVRTAIGEERLALARRLRDNGRRHHPRDGAEPAVVHKVRVAMRKPRDSPL